MTSNEPSAATRAYLSNAAAKTIIKIGFKLNILQEFGAEMKNSMVMLGLFMVMSSAKADVQFAPGALIDRQTEDEVRAECKNVDCSQIQFQLFSKNGEFQIDLGGVIEMAHLNKINKAFSDYIYEEESWANYPFMKINLNSEDIGSLATPLKILDAPIETLTSEPVALARNLIYKMHLERDAVIVQKAVLKRITVSHDHFLNLVERPEEGIPAGQNDSRYKRIQETFYSN
jgi:hypothetical protein